MVGKLPGHLVDFPTTWLIDWLVGGIVAWIDGRAVTLSVGPSVNTMVSASIGWFGSSAACSIDCSFGWLIRLGGWAVGDLPGGR